MPQLLLSLQFIPFKHAIESVDDVNILHLNHNCFLKTVKLIYNNMEYSENP